jgi:NAD(P)-dependent dehydrogenase (short-subunit alcohol dehydrogenase family)
LDITQKDIETSARINIVTATAFSQAAIKAFLAECVLFPPFSTFSGPFELTLSLLANSGKEEEKGGTIIMTGATSAWRGKEAFGAFAAGKHGLRALSQVSGYTFTLSWNVTLILVLLLSSRLLENTISKEFTSLSSFVLRSLRTNATQSPPPD